MMSNECCGDDIFTEHHLTFSQLIKRTTDKGKLPQEDRILKVDVLCNGASEDDYIIARTEQATNLGNDDAFYVMNINKLVNRYKTWTDKLPKVKPFFAVKSNNNPIFLSLLANFGMGFDCASKREIELILGLNVTSDNIIFAHPCKQLSHIRYARDKGVAMMTFDNEHELHKIAAEYKHAKLLVRIKYDDPAVLFRLGDKFGITVPEACQLIDTAKRLGLNIVGVCFHIGTGIETAQSFSTAIEMAHSVFEYATSVGYDMTILDIGGGFPGCEKQMQHIFDSSATIINTTIDKLFSNRHDLMIIAEPGQYMCHSSFSLVVNVTSIRNTSSELYYYVNDGILGSMLRWGFLTNEVVPPRAIKCHEESNTAACTIWGPTCATNDKICETVLPILKTGDWLVFDELGAYSLSLHSEFNGYPKPQVFWCVVQDDSLIIS